MSASLAIPAAPDRRVSEDLGLWEPKRALTLEAARAHTRRIQLFRKILIGISAALIVVLIWQFMSDRGGFDPINDPTESVRMENPRYSGRTSDGLPFFLTSDTAIRRMADRNKVVLNQPVLEFIRDEGVESSFVVAKDGSYDDMDKVLELRTDVNLATDDGNECDTSHARIFNVEKRIEGDEAIDCVGSFGSVQGQTYAIENAYRTFIFRDGVVAKLTQAQDAAVEDGAFGFGGDGPIDVTAQEGIYNGERTDLRGDVKVVQDGAVITSNEMEIFRVQKESADATSLKLGAVRQITAKGDFRYQTTENDIRGTQGVYLRDKNTMTVTGDVVVIQPSGNRVEAEKLTYDTKTGTIRFSGKCLGRDCGEDGRVGIRILGSGK